MLQSFAWAFTRPGYRRFAQWVTALALNVEEHTITQSTLAIERPADWKAMETFAEYGAWRPTPSPAAWPGWSRRPPAALARLPRLGRRRHQGPPQQPQRLGHLHLPRVHRPLPQPGHHRPGPQLGGPRGGAGEPRQTRLVPAYLRAALLPQESVARLSPTSGRTEPFRTKCELAVELIREQARTLGGRHLAVFDGGYALQTVVRPLVSPEDGSARIEFLTRLRHDARLYAPLPERHRPNQKWGRRLPPPRQGGRWTRHWHEGTAFIYGRQRKVRWKEIVCVWRVSGHDVPVKAVVAGVEGYKKRFTLVTSAAELTGLQMVELFAARFRQEDGFRDLKQRLGWEECRAWTRNPIERTSQAQWVTMSLLRLAQFRLEAAGEVDWWFRPPWNRKKDRPSVLDVERLFRRHRPEIQQHLSDWLGTEGEVA